MHMRITLRTIPFAATLLALPLFSTGAQTPERANQSLTPAAVPAARTVGRTPEETMAWFANEFPRLAWATTTDHTENGIAIRTYHRVRGVKLEGCTLTFASSVDTDSANVRGYKFAAYTIPLKDVNVAGVAITRADAGSSQWVRTEPASNVRLVAAKDAAFTYSTPDYQSENFVTPGVVRHEVRTASITVGDETEARRIASALTDAARLCGAKAG
jgi:hypothetical protein